MSRTPATDVELPESTDLALDEIKEAVSICMQCGTCTASCPNVAAMDHAPRHLLRLVQLGLLSDVLESKTFWLCSSCYTCTLRCPRGVPVTQAMAALKRVVGAMSKRSAAKKSAFYRTFMKSVRRYGRVQEADLMMRYFTAMRSPLLPFKFTPLAMKLMRKGKIHLPSGAQKNRLKNMFLKAAEMEGRE